MLFRSIIKAFSRSEVNFEYIAEKVKEKTGETVTIDNEHLKLDSLQKLAETQNKEKQDKEYKDKLEKYGIEIGKENSIEETSKILNNLGLTGQARVIWNLISKIADKLGVTVVFSESKDFNKKGAAGIYFLDNHSIYVDARKLRFDNNKDVAKTTVHEVVHGEIGRAHV